MEWKGRVPTLAATHFHSQIGQALDLAVHYPVLLPYMWIP
jgi:hypothetical protein